MTMHEVPQVFPLFTYESTQSDMTQDALNLRSAFETIFLQSPQVYWQGFLEKSGIRYSFRDTRIYNFMHGDHTFITEAAPDHIAVVRLRIKSHLSGPDSVAYVRVSGDNAKVEEFHQDTPRAVEKARQMLNNLKDTAR